MYDILGSKEARVAQAYYSHQEAKWDPKRWSIVNFYRQLKSLKDSSLAPMKENYLYYQLWRQMLEDFWERLIETNRPKTRDEIVKAIKQLETDRKRDRLKSNAIIQFQDFIAEFNSLATRCKKTTEQKVDALRLKVSQELSDAITHRDQPNRTDYNCVTNNVSCYSN